MKRLLRKFRSGATTPSTAPSIAPSIAPSTALAELPREPSQAINAVLLTWQGGLYYSAERVQRHVHAQVFLQLLYDFGVYVLVSGLAYDNTAEEEIFEMYKRECATMFPTIQSGGSSSSVAAIASHASSSIGAIASQSSSSSSMSSSLTPARQSMRDQLLHMYRGLRQFVGKGDRFKNTIHLLFLFKLALDHMPPEFAYNIYRGLEADYGQLTARYSVSFPNGSKLCNDHGAVDILNLYISCNSSKFIHFAQPGDNIQENRFPRFLDPFGINEISKVIPNCVDSLSKLMQLKPSENPSLSGDSALLWENLLTIGYK